MPPFLYEIIIFSRGEKFFALTIKKPKVRTCSVLNGREEGE
jgi:hypothetical protein